MTPEFVGIVCIVVLIALLILRVPVALAMMLVALIGYAQIVNPEAALARFGQDAFREGSNSALIVVPMFVLMGLVLANSGLGQAAYQSLDRFLWKLKGGLAVSTVGASAVFGAVNGSSVAGATTLSLIAVPEMRRNGYQPAFAAGVTAAGSTLGMLIPPSSLLVLYGLLTEVSVGDIMLAAIIPGLLTTLALIVTVIIIVARRPELVDDASGPPDISRRRAIFQIWPIPVIFGISMGGLYGGVFTANEAGAVGAAAALVYGFASRKLSWRGFIAAVSRTARLSAMVFLLVIAGKMFGYLLAVSRIPFSLGDWIRDLSVAPVVVLVCLFALYFVLGALMDETAILVIMTPIALPIVTSLGYDPVWFGVASIMMLLTGLIMPPVGILCFVVSGVTKVPLSDVYRAVLPFCVTLAVCVIGVFVVPDIALVLLH